MDGFECGSALRWTGRPRCQERLWRCGAVGSLAVGTFDTAYLEDGIALNSSHSRRRGAQADRPKSRFRLMALAPSNLITLCQKRRCLQPTSADVSRLLRLMVQSVYSHRERFVHELVLKPSRPRSLRSPSHPTRGLRPAPLGCEPARRGFRSAAARPDSSNPATPISARSQPRA